MSTNFPTDPEAADGFTKLLRESIASEPLPAASGDLRSALLAKLEQPAGLPAKPPVTPAPVSLPPSIAARRRTFFQRAAVALVSTAALALVAILLQEPARRAISWNDEADKTKTDAMYSKHGGLREKLPDYPKATLRNQQDGELTWFDERLQPSDFGPNEAAEFSDAMTGGPSPTGKRGPLSLNSGMGAGLSAPDRSGVKASRPRPSKDGERVDRLYSQPWSKPGADYDFSGRAAESAPRTEYDALVDSSGPHGESKPDAESARPSVPLARLETAGGYRGGPGAAGKSGEPSSGPGMGGAANGPLAFSKGEAMGDRGAMGMPGMGGSQGIPGGAPRPGESMSVVDRSKFNYERQLSQLSPAEGEKLAKSLGGKNGESRHAVEGEVAELAKIRSVDPNGVVTHEHLSEGKRLEDEVEQHRFRLLPAHVGEQYAKIVENQFLRPRVEAHALSTFSIDVDTASYANVRRFLNNGQLPPPDAVRLEELVNYFKYKYPQPKGDDPFSVNMEMADCPWQPGHKLLRVGLQGKEIHRAERPASNLVFLIDTSGSMTDENKLPLLKQAFSMLVGELGENDKVTIVTYAGNAGLRLEPTRGDQKEKILAAIEGMQSGGSTHGSAGIQLAYEHAAAQFIKGGTNKVILATDGDLNVGVTSDAALVELITKKAESGVFLTVLGVGTGNLKDGKMEGLADNGNGIYAYLDSVREARKVLVEEMSGSLVTIAKDVKIQIEFNPAQVESYRLLGYENRILAHKDFADDKKDAGEIGAGHSVTAVYQIALAGAAGDGKVEGDKTTAEQPLKYQRAVEVEKPAKELTDAAKTGELLTLKLRYKQPEGKESKLLEFPLTDKGGSFNSASAEMQFASAVVAFGLVLRDSEFRGSANFSAVAEIAGASSGEDIGGHRAEFLDLVRKAKSLSGK